MHIVLQRLAFLQVFYLSHQPFVVDTDLREQLPMQPGILLRLYCIPLLQNIYQLQQWYCCIYHPALSDQQTIYLFHQCDHWGIFLPALSGLLSGIQQGHFHIPDYYKKYQL